MSTNPLTLGSVARIGRGALHDAKLVDAAASLTVAIDWPIACLRRWHSSSCACVDGSVYAAQLTGGYHTGWNFCVLCGHSNRTLSPHHSIHPCAMQTFYNQADVQQVNVPGVDGDFGILANHVPLLTVLRPGVVAVTESAGAAPKSFFGV